jgi:hypothetical protein
MPMRHTLLAISFLCLVGCGIKDKDVVKPPSTFSGGLTFEDGTDWIRMPYPDSKFSPGSVVVIEKRNVRWIGHVADCGVPADILEPVRGNIGDFDSKRNHNYSAQAVLNIKGIEAGPEFNRVSTAELVQKEMSADSLNLIRLQLWLAEPANQAKIAGCNSILGEPDTFILG